MYHTHTHIHTHTSTHTHTHAHAHTHNTYIYMSQWESESSGIPIYISRPPEEDLATSRNIGNLKLLVVLLSPMICYIIYLICTHSEAQTPLRKICHQVEILGAWNCLLLFYSKWYVILIHTYIVIYMYIWRWISQSVYIILRLTQTSLLSPSPLFIHTLFYKNK